MFEELQKHRTLTKFEKAQDGVFLAPTDTLIPLTSRKVSSNSAKSKHRKVDIRVIHQKGTAKESGVCVEGGKTKESNSVEGL